MKKTITDELMLYRGNPHKIDDHISINVPKLGEICDYGELKYYGMVHTLCAVGVELCWQLEEAGIKFDEISDFELFIKVLCKGYGVEQTKILFGDQLDFQRMIQFVKKEDNSPALIQRCLESVPLMMNPNLSDKIICQIYFGEKIQVIKKAFNGYDYVSYNGITGYVKERYLSFEDDKNAFVSDNHDIILEDDIGCTYYNIIIDEKKYFEIVSYLRSIHNLKRDNRVAGTKSCRAAFIEDAKMEYEAKRSEPFKSVLLPMISTMVNMDGFKRNDATVWDMNIYAFMDSVKRIGKIKNSSLLLQSGYSGFGIDLKKIKKEELDYMGELN